MAYLIDTNVIIYASRPGPHLATARAFIATHVPSVSAITRVEAFGYHRLTETEHSILDSLFTASVVLPITDTVIGQAIVLRQQRKMSLGDAIIAATAVVHSADLATRNVIDFAWIDDLRVVDPFA